MQCNDSALNRLSRSGTLSFQLVVTFHIFARVTSRHTPPRMCVLIELQHMDQFAAGSSQPKLRSSPKTASSSLLKFIWKWTPPDPPSNGWSIRWRHTFSCILTRGLTVFRFWLESAWWSVLANHFVSGALALAAQGFDRGKWPRSLPWDGLNAAVAVHPALGWAILGILIAA